MADEPAPTPDQPRRRFQFTLRGLMVFVAGIAFGLSWASRGGSWPDELDWQEVVSTCGGVALAAASLWIVLGLVNQMRDLWRTFRGRTDLSCDERWGWRFALFWRAGVVALIGGHYAVTFLLAWSLLYLLEFRTATGLVGRDLRHVLLHLSLLFALCSALPSRRYRARSLRSGLIETVGAVAGFVLCSLVAWQQSTLPFICATTVQEIELGGLPQFAREGVDPNVTARTQRFFWQCALAAGVVLLTLWLTGQLARRWTRGRARRLIWGSLVALSVTATGCCLLWICTMALPAAFPVMIEAQEMGPLHRWATAALTILVVVTAAAYRMTRSPAGTARALQVKWRRHERAYCHEHRLVMLCVATAIPVEWLPGIFSGLRLFAHASWLSPWDFVQGLICHPPIYVALTLLAVALYGAFRRRRVGTAPAGDPRALPIGRFSAIWLALLLTAAFGIPIVVIFSFALWFSPWYLLPWP